LIDGERDGFEIDQYRKIGHRRSGIVLHIREIITGNKIWFPKDLLMPWLFTKIHFFLDTFSQYSYIVITF